MTRSAARIGLTLATTLALSSACGSKEEQPKEGANVPLNPSSTVPSPSAGGNPSAAPGAMATGAAASSAPAVTPGAPSTTAGSDGTGGAVDPGATPDEAVGTPGTDGETPTMTDAESVGGAGGVPGVDAQPEPEPAEGAGGMAGSAGAGGAGDSTPEPGAGGMNGAAGGGGGDEPAVSPLPPVDNYSDMGPYPTTTETNTGPDGTYTIIRPETLGEDGFLHAPITFGPGTGMQVSQMSGLLERIASHGFVIIGRQLDGGPGDPVTRMRLIDGLDWIIAQNSTAGSVFEGKLDVTHAIAMGYSVGATGSVEIGGHEAIATVVAIHGHSAEGDLHGPLLLIGGTDDTMGDGQSWLAPTYEASQVQTFFALLEGADHGYIQGSPGGIQGGTETPSIIAWIRYWIYNDKDAENYFFGDDCVMCSSPWSDTQRKNWP